MFCLDKFIIQSHFPPSNPNPWKHWSPGNFRLWKHGGLKLGNILHGTTVCHGHLWNLEPLSPAAPHSPGKSLRKQTGSDGRSSWSANANQTSLVTAVAAVLRGKKWNFLDKNTKRAIVNQSEPLSCTFLAKKKHLNHSEGVL